MSVNSADQILKIEFFRHPTGKMYGICWDNGTVFWGPAGARFKQRKQGMSPEEMRKKALEKRKGGYVSQGYMWLNGHFQLYDRDPRTIPASNYRPPINREEVIQEALAAEAAAKAASKTKPKPDFSWVGEI